MSIISTSIYNKPFWTKNINVNEEEKDYLSEISASSTLIQDLHFVTLDTFDIFPKGVVKNEVLANHKVPWDSLSTAVLYTSIQLT